MSQPVLLTVNGTGVPDPAGPGFSSDLGRALGLVNPWEVVANKLDGLMTPESAVKWVGVPYPAATVPMMPSVEAGRAELVRQIQMLPMGTPIFLSGYSQGAICTARAWALDCLPTNGVLHNRLNDIRGIIQFGDPVRCPGIANGNLVAGLPLPKNLDGCVTGGIAGPADLTPAQTPDFYLSCALDNDLYAAAPVAPVGGLVWTAESRVGDVETGIYNIIMQPTFRDLVAIAKDFFMPIATVEGAYNALTFFAAGTQAPHWQYQPFIAPMCDWILSRI